MFILLKTSSILKISPYLIQIDIFRAWQQIEDNSYLYLQNICSFRYVLELIYQVCSRVPIIRGQ